VAWEREHGETETDTAAFRREVLPLLQGATLTAMRRATGLSLSYCAQIKQGQRVPHARYWQPLQSLTP
jgi:hypothetical protein